MNLKNNVDFIIGKQLLQVCFGLYQIQLNFNDNIRIEIGSQIIYNKSNDIAYLWLCEKGREFFPICSLLEYTVTSYKFINNDLTLCFDNMENIIIKSSGDGYESYIVKYENDFEVIY